MSLTIEGDALAFKVWKGPYGPSVKITGYGDKPFFAEFTDQEWEILAAVIGVACARARGGMV